jgi:NTP pyrophosphatase (non-canonical NTP hydrolase)
MERLEELSERIKKFNEDRDWNQFHSPANLAKSIAIEAGELLECFQWSDSRYNMDNVLEELADVTNYCLQMAQILGVDIVDVVNKKMDVTEKKYPINKAKGVSTKYDKL